jgi:hypothetical protein
LAFVWRGVARLRKDPRFRWWVWASLGAVTLLLAFLQALPDPVDRLRRAVCKPTDEYALYEAYEAVGDVNRAGRGREAAALLDRLLSADDLSVRKTAVLALARVQADRKSVVSALTRAYEDEKLREPITFALGEIGPADETRIPGSGVRPPRPFSRLDRQGRPRSRPW